MCALGKKNLMELVILSNGLVLKLLPGLFEIYLGWQQPIRVRIQYLRPYQHIAHLRTLNFFLIVVLEVNCCLLALELFVMPMLFFFLPCTSYLFS